MKRIYSLLAAIVLAASSLTASPTATELIAASQSGSESIFFKIPSNKKFDVNVDGYTNPKEFTVRRGVPNFMRKCKEGKEVVIGYIGGSITKSADMYRLQSADQIAKLFPNSKMVGVNAGVAGTGSDLAACRLKEHMLQYSPDLLFIEFAVNGANAMGVEGIIRQTIKANPETDIVLIYTLFGNQAMDYAKGKLPASVAKLEPVAEHYNLPSVHMGMWSGFLIEEGKMLWKGNVDKAKAEGKEVFTKDGVHPLRTGGNYYASAVARAFKAMMSNAGKEQLTLIEPLHKTHMERAKTIKPSDLGIDSSWNVIHCDGHKDYDTFKYWFADIYDATPKSTPLKFKFKGNKIGLFDVGTKDCGAIEIIVDGQKLVGTKFRNHGSSVSQSALVPLSDPRPSVTRFAPQCINPWLRGQMELFSLPEALHEVEIRVLEFSREAKMKIIEDAKFKVRPDILKKYSPMLDNSVVHYGRVLIDGEIVK
ncbi:MAG: SGNH/GDSL hydrolase family protein [Rikenellaceae bacterium]